MWAQMSSQPCDGRTQPPRLQGKAGVRTWELGTRQGRNRPQSPRAPGTSEDLHSLCPSSASEDFLRGSPCKVRVKPHQVTNWL